MAPDLTQGQRETHGEERNPEELRLVIPDVLAEYYLSHTEGFKAKSRAELSKSAGLMQQPGGDYGLPSILHRSGRRHAWLEISLQCRRGGARSHRGLRW